MKTLYTNRTNLINLPFCHSSQFFSPNPNVPLFIPSTYTRKLTPKSSSISLKNTLFSSIQASMASSTVTEDTNKPLSVLFVCLGNICRSPAAEGVFTDLVKKRGFDSKFRVDSAGTIGYHEVGISLNISISNKNVIFMRKSWFLMMGFFRLFKKFIFLKFKFDYIGWYIQLSWSGYIFKRFLYEIKMWFLCENIIFFGFFMMCFWRLFKKFFFFSVKGNEADSRMRAASKRRGIQITSISRPIKPSDFVEFDLILAMDKQNKGRVWDVIIWIGLFMVISISLFSKL